MVRSPPRKVRTTFPVSASRSSTSAGAPRSSPPPFASVRPSGAKAMGTDATGATSQTCHNSFPPERSHTATAPWYNTPPPTAMRRPSGEKTREWTSSNGNLVRAGDNTRVSAPRSRSQRRTRPSPLVGYEPPLASVRPSGEKAMASTARPCPGKVRAAVAAAACRAGLWPYDRSRVASPAQAPNIPSAVTRAKKSIRFTVLLQRSIRATAVSNNPIPTRFILPWYRPAVRNNSVNPERASPIAASPTPASDRPCGMPPSSTSLPLYKG